MGYLAGIFILWTVFLHAEEKVVDNVEQMNALEEKLEALNIPGNQLPNVVNTDKLYSLHNRYAPLSSRHEISVAMGKNLTIDGFFSSNQVGLIHHYHFNDRFSSVLNINKVFNDLNSSGEILMSRDRIVPDKDYIIHQVDLGLEYNLFYGKFRLGRDRVFYFDQYVSLGAGLVELKSGSTFTATANVGLAFWAGRSTSVRFGLKNDFYEEENLQGSQSFNHNLVTYLSVGHLFGGGR